MNQGRWIHDNIQKFCPKAFEFVSKLEGLMQNCVFGNVFFSVLYPNTIIQPHCGPTNIRHRLHFSLSVPPVFSNSHNDDHDSEGPILKVLHNTMKWEEGKAFVFDDSLVHSAEYPNVENGSGEVRVVLVVDLWHPSLSDDEKEILEHLYPPM